MQVLIVDLLKLCLECGDKMRLEELPGQYGGALYYCNNWHCKEAKKKTNRYDLGCTKEWVEVEKPPAPLIKPRKYRKTGMVQEGLF